jgi:hypothetical protein
MAHAERYSQEDLDQLGLTREQADQIAIKNVRRIAFDGSTIKQQVTRTKKAENNWAVWMATIDVVMHSLA